MDIVLMPVGKTGASFFFPALPEKIKGKQAAKYQSFEILSKGTVKVPKGTEVNEISWEGEFFGESKQNETIVQKHAWRKPIECVYLLNDFIQKETVLNLIVTETWINLDVTIASFQPSAYGAYGNIQYSISFVEKKSLELYTTNELQGDAFVENILPRDSFVEKSGGTYLVVSGDTLWGIASKKLGDGSKWTSLYEVNQETIEAAAQSRGKYSSDHGHWIYPGTTLVIPE